MNPFCEQLQPAPSLFDQSNAQFFLPEETCAGSCEEGGAGQAALLRVRDEERTAELERANLSLQAEIRERLRAEREVRARARQHEAVAELGRRALLGIDLLTLFDGAVALVSATLEVDLCAFWERLPGTDILRLRAGVGIDGGLKAHADKIIGDESHLGYTAKLNEPVVSRDLEAETRFTRTPYLSQKGIQSTITIPVSDGVLYGVFTACSPFKEKFDQNEIFFLQTVANVLSSAIARKRSEAEIHQLNTYLQGANDELRAGEARLRGGNQIFADLMRLRVGTSDELREALRRITEAAGAMLDIERASVWLFNEEGTILRCHDLYQRSAHLHSEGMAIVEDGIYFPLIKTQSLIAADDARTDPATRDFWKSHLEPNGVCSLLNVALVVGGKHIGALGLSHTGTPRAWKSEDRTFASSLGAVCSLVLESFERTRAEAALHAAKEEAELATQEAQAANLAKSEFLSRMSHELRTPLNAILGFGQILEMRDLPRPAPENIRQILKAGRHLLSLINEVLDITRIEAGQLSLSLEPVCAGLVAQETLDLVRPLAHLRGIHLENALVGECGEKYLWADQQRFKQVLLNLLSNAVKYNREGGQVFVECEIIAGAPSLRDGTRYQGQMRICVRDTGSGLSPEDISKLFVPFERLAAARTQIEGTGIGLTLCKRLVEAMDGCIGVRSEVGRGSTFWVELPLVSSPLERIAFIEAEMPDEAVSLGRAKTILYIEDNLSNINLIQQALFDCKEPVRFLTAMQGSVGLELATQHLPDLILLDVHLPDIMGDVVLRHLKEDVTTRSIPVVVLSADATRSQIERLLGGGAHAYLTKPLDLKQFFRVLDEVMGQSP